MDLLGVEKTNTIFIMNGFLFTIVFFSVRIAPIPLNTKIWWQMYNARAEVGAVPVCIIGVCMVLLNILNCIWMKKILMGLVKIIKLKIHHNYEIENKDN